MEGVRFDGDALDLIAHRAQGGMRDALTSLDQLIAFGEGEVTTELAERLLGSLDSSDLADIVKAIGERDAAACFRWTSQYMETGADLVQFVADLTSHMRDMYVMSLAGADVALEVTEAGRRELEVELGWYGTERLARMLSVLGDLANELKTSTNQRLSFEIALTRMVRPESDLTLASLAERIESLERGMATGALAVPVVAQPQMQQAQPSAMGGASAGTQASTPAAEAASTEPSRASLAAEEPQAASAEAQQASQQVATEPQAAEPQAADNQPAGNQPASSQPAGGQPEGAEPAGAAASNQAATQDVSRLWASVLAHLKKIGPAFGVIFMNTATSMSDGKLVIAFDPTSDFAFKAAQKQDAREALEKAMDRAGAQGMRYEIVKGEPGQVKAAQQDASQNAATQAHHSNASAPTSQATAAQPEPAAQQPDPKPQPAEEPFPTPGAIPVDAQSGSTPEVQEPSDDPDFQDFLASAFGEGIVVEEIQE